MQEEILDSVIEENPHKSRVHCLEDIGSGASPEGNETLIFHDF